MHQTLRSELWRRRRTERINRRACEPRLDHRDFDVPKRPDPDVRPFVFVSDQNQGRYSAATTTKRAGPFSSANCSVALRSSSGSVRCIKHNYPDHRDKSKGHNRGQRHEPLPVVGLWSASPNLSVTTVTAPAHDKRFTKHCTVLPDGVMTTTPLT